MAGDDEPLAASNGVDSPSDRDTLPPPSATFDPNCSDPSGNNTTSGNISVPVRDAKTAVDSVVPDLMRVYESMTQSSTPQDHAAETTVLRPPVTAYAPSAAKMVAEASARQGQPSDTYYNMHSWGFEASNVIIPPIPEAAFAAMGAAVGDHTDFAEADEVPSSQNNNNNDPAVTVTSTAGRNLRKRMASQAPLKEDSGSTSGNSTSEGRSSSKSRRKGKDKDSDARWSKRFTWPDELHRDFVSAIFDVGLKHSSPSTILECMPRHAQITSERVKSHLQKYRLHREKAKKDFMTSYESTVSRMQKEGLEKVHSLAGGEVPALLTYATLSNQDIGAEQAPSGARVVGRSAAEESRQAPSTSQQQPDQGYLMLPRLTEDEKRSPLGSSMGYLIGLFFSLKQQLVSQRAAKVQAAVAMAAASVTQQDHPVSDVFDSFIAGQPGPLSGYDGLGRPVMAAPQAVAPSTRSNLEESNMMKREMQNQMAFQNKMRALKQQELNKYRRPDGGYEMEHIQAHDHPTEEESEDGILKGAGFADQDFQGAGETADDGPAHGRDRSRGLSIGVSDEFWNSDVVDDQLFEFLLNN